LVFLQKYKNRLLLKYNNFKKINKTFSFLVISLILIASCNPNKEKWLNKKWHSLVGHYNIYFNGEEKLNEAITSLSSGHVNDFNKILDIFPYGTDAQAKGVNNLLDDAMKKFSGSIQLHRVGSYTDESWFGIAKTHFFKRDFYASQEAMQFMISKYPVEYKNISTAWIAKSYIGLGKPQEAEAVIGLVLSNKKIEKKDLTEIYLTAADINIRLEKYKSAIDNLNKVFAEGKLKKEEKIRYRFILGQLYANANDNKNAIFNFNKVISLVPSYDFGFNANINITKLYDVNDKKSVNKVRRNLKKMSNDDKNEDFLSQIYYELGKLELSQKNYQPAIIAFKKSNEKIGTKLTQKPKTTYELAKLYFELKDYKNARAFYDTTALLIDKKDKQYNSIIATKMVLSELINNLEVYETEDSLQTLAKLSKDELNRKVIGWINAENKRKEIEAKELQKRRIIEASLNANKNNNPGNINNAPQAFDNTGNGNQWYFYNTALASAGYMDFTNTRKWGNRINEDFWRIASKEKEKKQSSEADSTDETDKNKNPNVVVGDLSKDNNDGAKEIQNIILGDPNKDAWLKNIPNTTEALEASNLNMMEALHNLGNIYFNKINNFKEAINYYNILQRKFPKKEYEPEAWYYLHKSHIEFNETNNAQKYKDDLLSIYPNNSFTLLLLGKVTNTASNDENKELVKLYDKTFEAYKNNNFEEVKLLKAEADKKYSGNNLRPKFEFLLALSVGKTGKVDEFKQALTFITKEFPKTDVSEEAKQMLLILNKTEKKIELVKLDSALVDFELEPNEKHYYIFAIKNVKANFTDYVEKTYAYNEAFAANDNLRINALMSNEGYQYLLVREFANQKKAEEYYKGIIANNVITNKLKVTEPYIDFIISINNYKNIMKDKQMEKYFNFYKKIQQKL
jgi:tetratricopeptide (TPR) repeat protein